MRSISGEPQAETDRWLLAHLQSGIDEWRPDPASFDQLAARYRRGAERRRWAVGLSLLVGALLVAGLAVPGLRTMTGDWFDSFLGRQAAVPAGSPSGLGLRSAPNSATPTVPPSASPVTAVEPPVVTAPRRSTSTPVSTSPSAHASAATPEPITADPAPAPVPSDSTPTPVPITAGPRQSPSPSPSRSPSPFPTPAPTSSFTPHPTPTPVVTPTPSPTPDPSPTICIFIVCL
jgi:hypothetical protein